MINVNNITAGYQKKVVLNNVSLEIPENEITCIIGPNGCGKSTLLKCLARQLPVQSGEIVLDDKNIELFSQKEFAQKVTYLKQSRNVPSITVEGLVLHGRFPYMGYPRKFTQKDKDIAKKVMKQTGVWEYKDKYLTELSGGECQKVYLAMSLAQDTEILLLDEPTTFLDIKYQLELLDIIKELKQNGKTIVVILHDIVGALNLSKNICLMSKGEIISFSNPLKILENGLLEKAFDLKVSYTINNGKFEIDFSNK